MQFKRIDPQRVITQEDTSQNDTLDSARNTKTHVGSIIGAKLHHITNRTSTKWMKVRLGSQEGSTRPNTTKKMDQTRMRSQTTHKDGLEERKVGGSAGDSNKLYKHHRYNEKTQLLFQNSWIPNSYRVSRVTNEEQNNTKETDDKPNKIIIKKIIPKRHPPASNIIITDRKE